jgi:AmmeMemoRadiSam system protein B
MFYEASPDALRARIEWAYKHPLGPGSLPTPSTTRRRESIGFVVPHAGYMYSGPVAAHAYYRLALEGPAETYVIAGPNHTGLGTLVSAYPEGAWVTPLGEVEVDAELARAIAEHSEMVDLDEKAHVYEHSVEVQIPFLQHLFGNRFKIVPIVMWEQTPETARDLARAVYEAARALGRDVVFLASTDFTHYEPHDVASKKDSEAIEAIASLDPERLFSVITEKNISMCGPGPVMALLYLARMMKGRSAQLLKYATSGDITGDRSSVVGYAAIRVY